MGTDVENDSLLRCLMLFSSPVLYDHSSDQEKCILFCSFGLLDATLTYLQDRGHN